MRLYKLTMISKVIPRILSGSVNRFENGVEKYVWSQFQIHICRDNVYHHYVSYDNAHLVIYPQYLQTSKQPILDSVGGHWHQTSDISHQKYRIGITYLLKDPELRIHLFATPFVWCEWYKPLLSILLLIPQLGKQPSSFCFCTPTHRYL